jgi:hypothetical protein
LVVGGGLIASTIYVLRFLYIAIVGLGMIGLAVDLFVKGSIIWGLIVLLVGTPLAIGIASYLFIPLFGLTVVALLIWGTAFLFGFHIEFQNAWGLTWLILGILLWIVTFSILLMNLLRAIKNKSAIEFFKESWLLLIFLIFISWMLV